MSSRRENRVIARPTNSFEVPPWYTFAVCQNVTPSSTACRKRGAAASSSSVHWCMPAAASSYLLVNLVQDVTGGVGLPRADVGAERCHQALQVVLGQSGVEPDGEVGLELGVDAVQVGQGGDGGDLPALEVEVVAAEYVAEQVVALEELVDGRGEGDVFTGCRGADQTRLVLGAEFDAALVGGKRARFRADLIGDAVGFTVLQHGHERGDAVETAGEPGVGVHLDEDFLDLVDRQPSVRTLVQGLLQARHLAAGGERRDGHALADFVVTA